RFDLKPMEELEARLKIEASQNRENTSGDSPAQYVNCPPPPPLTSTSDGFCAQALSLHVPVGIEQNNISALPGQSNSLSTFEDVLTINLHKWGHTITSVTGYYNYHFDVSADMAQIP